MNRQGRQEEMMGATDSFAALLQAHNVPEDAPASYRLAAENVQRAYVDSGPLGLAFESAVFALALAQSRYAVDAALRRAGLPLPEEKP